jgi:hypothetical protein
MYHSTIAMKTKRGISLAPAERYPAARGEYLDFRLYTIPTVGFYLLEVWFYLRVLGTLCVPNHVDYKCSYVT